MQKRAEALAAGQTVNYHVGVILVEFSDTLHYLDTRTQPTRPNGYYIRDFENMLFGSPGDWYWPDEQNPQLSPHPEHDLVFGSMRDYWYQQSIPNGVPGALQVIGQVVNPPVDPLVANPVPRWIRMDNSKLFYHNSGLGGPFKSEAMQKAKDSLWIPQDPFKPNGPYDHIIIVYAGETLFEGKGLNPHYSGKKHIMGERILPAVDPQVVFSHIGIHAHEFGHRLGMWDYAGAAGFGLMASTGATNGPARNHACPAAVEPFLRIGRMGWVTPIDTIEQNMSNFVVEYDYLSPKFYILKSLYKPTSDYFLIETRGRTGFDRYTPLFTSNFNGQDGALLIWRDGRYVIPADNELSLGWVNDFFPTTGMSSQDWNDETVPGSNLRNGQYSHIALQNIVWNYKTNPEDTSTTIGEIMLNYGFQVINSNTT